MARDRQAKNQKAVEQADKPENNVDRAVEESFPASDPPSYSTPHLSDAEAAKSVRTNRLPPKLPPDIKPASEEKRHQDKSARH